MSAAATRIDAILFDLGGVLIGNLMAVLFVPLGVSFALRS